ncbi:MAG TPA: transposase [Kofleriaceae bacterium]|jgi:REP element-mobilizing transposase RayT
MAARARKRHEQLAMFNARGTKADQRRGKARGGRPRKTARGSAPHTKRKLEVRATWPVHVVLRVVDDVKGLRNRRIYKALRNASISALRQHDEILGSDEAAKIIHISIQQSHIHLIVEAPDQKALSRAMQGFKISAAKWINRALSETRGKRRRGAVFAERYFAEVIKTPRQARNTLAYVLNNWRKHGEDKRQVARGWLVDPFSTGAVFGGWRELVGRDTQFRVRESYDSMLVWLPESWLLKTGWRRHGAIGCREVPSSPARTVAAGMATPE